MRTESEIRRRIEQCEFRSKEYETEAQRAKSDDWVNYWMEQSAIQDEISHALKWVLNNES